MIKKIKQIFSNYVNSLVDKKFDLEFDKRFQTQIQFREFNSASNDFLASKVEGKTSISKILIELQKFNIPIIKTKIDITDYKKWLKKYPEINDFYSEYGDVKIEKTLEHYLSMKYLNISKKDVFIDIASSSSPFATILSKHGQHKAYSQDLIFEPGIKDTQIGGDAGNMPIENNFADVLSLQCAFECFQGDSDIYFIKEAQRVLKNKGRLGIVPLYLDKIHFVKTGYMADKRNIQVEKEARWIWRDDEYKSEPFSRHYSTYAFQNRIINNLDKKIMDWKLLHFTNLEELRNKFPNQRIYCNFMFITTKK